LPRDINVVVLGDKTTIELDNLCMLSNFVNLINKTTIEEAADIIKNSKLYIGNDSGLTHVALKFDIPFICILGGGAFGYYFPVFESERTKYIYKKLECFNCDLYCKFNEPKCLTQISVDEVYKEAINMLNNIMYKISIKNIIFNKSARFYLHLKNYFSFILFILVKPFISSKNIGINNKTILFFNNGQIGDLLVSSIILENEDLLPKSFKYVFLIKEEYLSLFKNYKGLFEIETFNLSEYRFNIKYKLNLINELNNLGIAKFFNLCAARGILTEEFSYFIKSDEKIALNKSSFYLDSKLLNYLIIVIITYYSINR
jgi:hypothetical protein